MVLFSSRKKENAGLYIDKGMFRYLSLSGNEGDYSVTHAVAGVLRELPGNDGGPFADSGTGLDAAFAQIAETLGDSAVRVNAYIPTTDALLRIVPMQDMDLADAKLAFRYDFERYFPIALDDSVFDMAEIEYPLPDGKTEKRFLVAVTRSALIERITDAASAYGIKLGAIEPAQIALERAITPPIPPCDAAVYIYAGLSRSVIILSWKGKGIFYRAITFDFKSNPSEPIPDTNNEDSPSFVFVREIRSSIQFALSQIRGFVPQAAYVFGPWGTESLCDLIKEAVDIPTVMLADPLRVHGIEMDEQNIAEGCWDISVGLALRQ
jgi:type IV pilus assembly protein PilM